MQSQLTKANKPPELSYAASLNIINRCYIDVRSPSEYAADHIPGAFNLPLFDDEQRAKIGAIYHNISQNQARLSGLELAIPRLPWLLGELRQIHLTGYCPILYCWRGGLRSQAVQEAATLQGLPCLRLAGGYKEYRHWVLDILDKPLPFPVITLHGLTGCGKTAILRLLREKHDLQVLDLEGLAQHRGSVFGHIGLAGQPTQKYFQSLLAYELFKFSSTKPLLLECESRRVGCLLLHDNLYSAIKNGLRILVYDSPRGRAYRLLMEYAPAQNLDQIIEALNSPALKAKFSATRLYQLAQQIQAGTYEEVIEYLLIHYYDPLYYYPGAPTQDYSLTVNSVDIAKAAKEIERIVKDIECQK